MLLESQHFLPVNTWEWKSACLELLLSQMALDDRAHLHRFQCSLKMFPTFCFCLSPFSADPEWDVFIHFSERQSGHKPPSTSSHRLIPSHQTFFTPQLSSLSSAEGRSQSWLLQSTRAHIHRLGFHINNTQCAKVCRGQNKHDNTAGHAVIGQ